MIFQLFRRSPESRIIAALYGTIVAQARAVAFYQNYNVPDTVNARFEMLVLHVVIVLDRLRREAAPIAALGQGIFDQFCDDMDGHLREMGVGDLSVPTKMRRIGEAFYGRQAAYEAALAARGQLAEVLSRTVFGVDREPDPGALRLAAYAREAVGHLAAQDASRIGRSELTFPDPDQITVRG